MNGEKTELNKSVLVALNFMLNNFKDDINLDIIANNVGINKYHLCRLFKSHIKTGPVAWLWRFRTFLSAEIIYQRPLYSLDMIRTLCGFKYACHFTRQFKEQIDVRPSALRKFTLSQTKNKSKGSLYHFPYNEETIKIAFNKTMMSLRSKLVDEKDGDKNAKKEAESNFIRL